MYAASCSKILFQALESKIDYGLKLKAMAILKLIIQSNCTSFCFNDTIIELTHEIIEITRCSNVLR